MKRDAETPAKGGDRSNDVAPSGDNGHTGLSCDDNNSNGENRPEPKLSESSRSRLVSRVLVTWIELTVVGITGGLLGAAVGGPPGFIIYLTTTLLTVGILFYNVNELIKRRVERR